MKYERLTKIENGILKLKNTNNKSIEFVTPSCGESSMNALNRLAELEDKIEQGTLIELPCKVGDKIYIVHKKPLTGWCFYKSHLHYYNMERVLEEYGKFIFLTREEAEKRLKELQNGRSD